MFTPAVLALAILAGGTRATAQSVNVDINVSMKHTVGGISTFDREKFITIHSSHTDSDWDGGQQGAPNFTNDLLAAFIEGYDVYFGRDTGAVTWNLKNTIDEDGAKPGWPLVSPGTWSIANQGQYRRGLYDNDASIHPYESRAQTDVMAAQFRPFWPDGTLTARGWALSQTDTIAEPFGSATGNYMGHFLNHFYGSPTQVGRPLPKWVEIMNEPDWPLFEWPGDPAYGTSSPGELWTFHNAVANQIRNLNTNVMIGGYCPAFPDPEKNNFQEWTDEWVTFIDTCGTNMDFYSIHLYDIDDSNKYLIRRGSFAEAVMDMIEHYSEIQLGKPLPFVVSEYAGKDQVLGSLGWNALHDWKRVKSMSGFLMSFMDRPNLIGKTIPFIVVKAEWGRNPTTMVPYSARLMRQAGEPASYTGDWVYTEHVKFYELWRDVKGTRVDIVSSDPDIQADAYVDTNKAYVILNNLTKATQTIDLNLFEDHGNTVPSVREKNMYWNGSIIALDDTVHAGGLALVQLQSEGTVVLEYEFAGPVNVNHTSDEVKYYAENYFQSISAGVPRIFNLNGVSKGTYGDAVLRLGMGRAHSASKQPTVLFNGIPLTVPTDFMGHEGDDRSTFFGLLDIPVPYSLLQSNNTISVTYSDSGGYISSVALRAYQFSKPRSVTVPGSIIASAEVTGGQLLITVANGTPSGPFDVLTSTDLLTPLGNWATNQAGLYFDSVGAATVTNPISGGQAYFLVQECFGCTSTPPMMATFDWEEVTVGSSWWLGDDYTETENGITLVASGRAFSIDTSGNGRAIKANYAVDANPGSFVMQVGGVDQPFVVTSIDISGNGNVPNAPSVSGRLGGVQQWEILPPADAAFYTYTTATSGDLSLEIVWNGPWEDPGGTVWGNEIDNLMVSVELP